MKDAKRVHQVDAQSAKLANQYHHKNNLYGGAF